MNYSVAGMNYAFVVLTRLIFASVRWTAASTTAICGNGVVEGDEECDCGWEDECHEHCCYPQTATSSSSSSAAAAAAAGRPCTRRLGAECRSLQTPCVHCPILRSLRIVAYNCVS